MPDNYGREAARIPAASASPQNSRTDAIQAARNVFAAARGPVNMPPELFVDFICEPRQENERPTVVRHAQGGGAAVWQNPYVCRVIALASKFSRLSEEDRRYIISAKEDGVYWRGDDMELFQRIAPDVSVYKDLSGDAKDLYRKALTEKMRRCGGWHAMPPKKRITDGPAVDAPPRTPIPLP